VLIVVVVEEVFIGFFIVKREREKEKKERTKIKKKLFEQ
jgi:uncharacterized protein YneF (UPF0154 family)